MGIDPALLEHKGKICVSKSGLGDFEKCPRLFKFAHLDRLPRDSALSEAKKPASWEMGAKYHNLFQTAFDFEEAPSTDATELQKQMFPDEPIDDVVLQKYADNFCTRLISYGSKYYKPIMSEMFLTDYGRRVRGSIDALFRTPDFEYMIAEYKPTVRDVETEILIYAHLCKSVLNIHCEWGAVYGYKDGKWAVFRIDWDMLDEVLERIDKVIAAIDNNTFEKDDTDCKWCDFKVHCIAEDLGF